MIFSLALSVAAASQSPEAGFHAGPWRGRCYREGSLQGMDHELCTAAFFDEKVLAGAQIVRTAEGIEVTSWPGECATSFEPALLPALALAGAERSKVVAAFVQRQIDNELKACKPKSAALKVRAADMAAFLDGSDNLRAGSFVPLDAAVRAPAAGQCGRRLEADWRAAIAKHPAQAGGKVKLMMYTFSKPGPDRAEARFKAQPALMENFFSMGMGPGGSVISAQKDAASWQDAPADWFVTLCDVGIEAWSGFVELGLYDREDDPSPAFTVRADTGVAGREGYAIWSQ
jgi:hypothetical protein